MEQIVVHVRLFFDSYLSGQQILCSALENVGGRNGIGHIVECYTGNERIADHICSVFRKIVK